MTQGRSKGNCDSHRIPTRAQQESSESSGLGLPRVISSGLGGDSEDAVGQSPGMSWGFQAKLDSKCG